MESICFNIQDETSFSVLLNLVSASVSSWKKTNAVMKRVRLKRKRTIKEERKMWIKEEIIVGREVKTPWTPNCLCWPTVVSSITWPTTGHLWPTECVKLSNDDWFLLHQVPVFLKIKNSNGLHIEWYRIDVIHYLVYYLYAGASRGESLTISLCKMLI